MGPSDQQITLWFHYEEIAMHFNELIIRYRLQLMGGTGAIGAIGFFLVQGKNIKGPERRFYRLLLSGLMSVLVLAAYILDYWYYHQLLKGAVDALLEFEAKNSHINMSTHIQDRVKATADYLIFGWYASILVPLSGFTYWSYRRYKNPPKEDEDESPASRDEKK